MGSPLYVQASIDHFGFVQLVWPLSLFILIIVPLLGVT